MWLRGVGSRIRLMEQAEGAGRWSRQTRSRANGVERKIGKGDLGVGVGKGSMGQGEGKRGVGVGRRMNISDNCLEFTSYEVNRCFYAI